jgi:hypothetical protein
MTERQIDKVLARETYGYDMWKNNFNHLKEFYEKNGPTWIKQRSKKKKDRSVCNWASRQRSLIRKDNLHPLKLEMLQSINFLMDYYDNCEASLSVRNERSINKNSFDAQLKLILQWKEKHGRWPNIHNSIDKTEKYLGSVVSGWRLDGMLYPEQIDILDDHNFIWKPEHIQFEKKIARIKAFKEKFGSYRIGGHRKDATDYDRATSILISVLRTNKAKKEKWQLVVIKKLKLDEPKTFKNKG